MKLMRSNILIVMLMLLTFTGQTLAKTTSVFYVASCAHESMNADMPMMSHNAITGDMAHEMMSHDSVMLSENTQDSIMDCCQEQCQCPMNGFVSLPFLFNSSFNAEVRAEQKIFQLSSLHQSQINSSLYRPPIS